MMYPLVDRLAEEGVPIVRSAEVLGFNTTSFYKWKSTPLSARERYDAELVAVIGEIHADDPEFGYRFIWDELKGRGHAVGRDRVRRLCRQHKIHSSTVKPKSRRSTAGPPVTDDLLCRHFDADTCDVAWVSDITEHPTDEGKWYFCAIKDLCSTRIVGYQSGARMTSRLVCDALEHAIDQRDPTGTIVHSDRGGQGGIKWSSQHLGSGGGRGPCSSISRWPRFGRCAARSGRRGDRRRFGVSTVSSSGGRSPAGCRPRTRRARWACHPRSGRGGSGKLAGCHHVCVRWCRAATSRSGNARRSRSCAPSSSASARSADGSSGIRRRSLASCAATHRPVVGRRRIVEPRADLEPAEARLPS
jgi:putative transposase